MSDASEQRQETTGAVNATTQHEATFCCCQRIAELEGENARLRVALQKSDDYLDAAINGMGLDDEALERYLAIRRRNRAALAPEAP